MALRALKMSDIRAVTRYANTLAREEGDQPRSGYCLPGEEGDSEGRTKVSEPNHCGKRTKDEVSIAAFDGNKMIGHCHVSRLK
jgi:hypothetical protein